MVESETKLATIPSYLTTIHFKENELADIKRIVKLAGKLGINLHLHTSPTELTICGMDGSHIGLVYATIPATIRNPQTIDMEMSDLNKIIEKTTGEFYFEYDRAIQKLEINEGIFHTKMSKYDVSSEEINMESLFAVKALMKNSATITIQNFKQLMERTKPISEVIFFRSLGNQLEAYTESSFAELSIKLTKPFLKEVSINEPFDACYAVQFLENISEETFIQPTFYFRNEGPLCIEENFASGCKVLYFIAPRIFEEK